MKYFLLITLFTIFNGEYVKTIPPPGTVYLSNDTFIDVENISIQSWKEYVMVKEYHNEIAFYPDTSYTVNGLNYYNSSYFNSKPVIKLSFEAIQSYIDWRTKFINNNLSTFSNKSTCRDKFYVKSYKNNVRVSYKLADKEKYLEAIEKNLLLQVDKDECFSEDKWTDFSTFRCIATFTTLDN